MSAFTNRCAVVPLSGVLPSRRLVEIPPAPSLTDALFSIFRDSHKLGRELERETAQQLAADKPASRETVTLP